MTSFYETFKKQGGFTLIKAYWKAGVLLYALLLLIVMGHSKKSLELLRLAITQKINKKLKKKYTSTLKSFDTSYKETEHPQKHSNIVWVFWMQGIENAPALVQRCYQSLQANLKDRKIILITEKNINDYVQFPDFILEKLKKGIITYTHFSDLLRLELLTRYGGTWIDATVFCSSSNIPHYMLDDDLFVFQNLRPGDNGSVINMSSWFMTSCSNNKILLATKELLYTYWKKNNYMIDYFLIHHFMMITANYYKESWSKIVQFPNSLPHVLLLMLFDPFNQEKWDAITEACPFHKLAYKRSKEDMEREGTFFEHIMNLNIDFKN